MSKSVRIGWLSFFAASFVMLIALTPIYAYVLEAGFTHYGWPRLGAFSWWFTVVGGVCTTLQAAFFGRLAWRG